MRCDFCYSAAVKWRYAARHSHAVSPQPVGGFFLHYADLGTGPEDTDWMACEECKELIASGKREGLVDRVMTSPHSNYRIIVEALPDDDSQELRAMVRELHDTFWKNREGPPREVTP